MCKLKNKRFAQPTRMHCSLKHQEGASLLMVMLILIIVSILGVGGAQIALMGERSARNDRDYQVAWQSAEAALLDAEFDMRGPTVGTRQTVFDSVSTLAFIEDCGDSSSGTSRGLCLPNLSGKPVWLTADLTSNATRAVEFGTFTGRTFDSGAVGIKPELKPRYLIETVLDSEIGGLLNQKKYVYRVTSIGFGPRRDIQVVMQMIFRKE